MMVHSNSNEVTFLVRYDMCAGAKNLKYNVITDQDFPLLHPYIPTSTKVTGIDSLTII